MHRHYLRFCRAFSSLGISYSTKYLPVSKHVRLYDQRKLINNLGYIHFYNTDLTHQHKKNTKRPAQKISNINDLFAYIRNGKVFYLKQLKTIFSTIDFGKLNQGEIILLLQHCGKIVPDSSKQDRNDVCQKIFENVLKTQNLDLNVYHAYITTCTENKIELNVQEFLNLIKCQPDKTTYKLLLMNNSTNGNVPEAIKILEIMKLKGIPVDEEVFNNLVHAHILAGGMQLGEVVLKTMKSAQIPESINTKLSILKAVSSRNDLNEFIDAVKKYSAEFDEQQLLELIECLGLSGNQEWLSKTTHLFDKDLSREFQLKINNICLHLLHMNQVESAIYIYQQFMDPLVESNYGFYLLKEMLHLSIDVNIIISLAKEFKNKELNLKALEDITNIALRHGYVEQSWALLSNLETLRPHYFWPLLIIAKNVNGEKGLMDEISKITELKVHLDYESLEKYVFNFCDLYDPEGLVSSLQKYGYTVTEILSPLIMVLLRKRSPERATQLCQRYNVPLTGEEMLTQLAFTWSKTTNTEAIMELVAKYCESNVTSVDHIGDFLKTSLELCENKKQIYQFETLLKAVKNKMLKISYTNSDHMKNILATLRPMNLSELLDNLNGITEFQITVEASHIPHPRDMNMEQLECHLEELTEKVMETRGVIRRLILLHCGHGNHQRVQELRQIFIDKEYEETAGMKSSMMHSYIEGGHVEEAIDLYKELRSKHPSFQLDNYKVLDLVTLLVKQGDMKNAVKFIQSEARVFNHSGAQSTRGNCLNLLNACTNTEDQMEIFNLLVKHGFCLPNNVMLGPIIRLLIKSDLKAAVDKYVECTQHYRCTPLQLELLCAVLEKNDDILLKQVLVATQNVHGYKGTCLGYVSAMAEKGHTNRLTKFLGTLTISLTNEINKRCDRWVKEGKLEPMKRLLEASDRIPTMVLEKNVIYKSIMKIYSIKNDCESAIEFYNNLSEDDDFIKKNVEKDLTILLQKCNYNTKIDHR